MTANPGLPRLRRLSLAVALLAVFAGCEEDSVPQITQLDAEPTCDIITTHVTDLPDGSTLEEDYLEVRFFARASGGNGKSDPTGANSPLDWRWEFGDGSGADNVVNPTHRYTEPSPCDPATGECFYLVRLTVTDDDGDTDERTLRVFVGQQYSDLDILEVESETIGDSRISFSREDTLNVFEGWTAEFSGSLDTPCPIGGLFQTYLWEWVYGDGDTDLHIGAPSHLFPPTAVNYEVILRVTENNTEVAREDTTIALHPAGVRLSNTENIALPGQSVNLRVDGLLLVGTSRVRAYFSWPDTLETSASTRRPALAPGWRASSPRKVSSSRRTRALQGRSVSTSPPAPA